jgi:hypothetical protein
MVQHSGMESDDMSVTRQQLKSIVKECLVEILAEGIGSTKKSIQEVALKTNNVVSKKPNSVQSRRGEHVKYSQTMAETIKREAGGNSIMAEILADTAATTLPSMLKESAIQHKQPIGSVERVVADSTPEELFGDDAASKWAQLAFTKT